MLGKAVWDFVALKGSIFYNPRQLFFYKADIGIQQINYAANYMVIEVPIK